MEAIQANSGNKNPKYAVYKCILNWLNGNIERSYKDSVRKEPAQLDVLLDGPAAVAAVGPAAAAVGAASKWQHVSTTTVGTTKLGGKARGNANVIEQQQQQQEQKQHQEQHAECSKLRQVLASCHMAAGVVVCGGGRGSAIEICWLIDVEYCCFVCDICCK